MTTTTSSADPRRGRHGGRVCALLLALALLLCLSACGQADPVCGRWVCVSARVGELSVPASLLGEEPARLFLSSDGRGTLSRGGAEGSLRWSREGEVLRLDLGGKLYDAAISPEELCLTLEPGTLLRFQREDRAAEPAQNAVPSQGAWYGWWEVSESRGRMPDSWRDCCAVLDTGDFGPELRLWDEDSSCEQPLAVVQLRWEGETLSSESGFFLLEPLARDAWRLDLSASPVELRGSYRHEDESFAYRFHLRPWGETWSGEERLPFRYNDWYLPLIDANEPMPGRIG